VLSGRVVELIIHHNLVPSLRMSGAIPSLSLRFYGVMLHHTQDTLYLTLYPNMHETNARYSHDLPYLNLHNITIREGLGKISNVS